MFSAEEISDRPGLPGRQDVGGDSDTTAGAGGGRRHTGRAHAGPTAVQTTTAHGIERPRQDSDRRRRDSLRVSAAETSQQGATTAAGSDWSEHHTTSKNGEHMYSLVCD